MVLGPEFVGGGDTADFGHAFSNCTYVPARGRFRLSSVQRAPRVGAKRKIEEDRKNCGKPKSANKYVVRPK